MVFKRSPRGSAVLLLSAVFITLGIVGSLQSELPFLFLGVGLLIYYYVSKLVLELKISAVNRLQVARDHPARIDEEQKIDVTVSMINSTFLRIGTEVFDSYPSFCRLSSGTNVAVVNIPAKGFSKLSYTLSTTSVGVQQFGPLRLLVRDIAGLFFYERDIDVQSSVEVTPKGDVIPRGALAGLALSTYGGAVTSRRKGEGFDFADIRKYQVGDPYKRIEWSSTARSRQLMVRETSLETQLNVMVALDITETMAYGEAGQTKLDYSARAVASLARYLAARGDSMGLTLMGGTGFTQVIPLTRGRGQVTMILRTLSGLTFAPNDPRAVDFAVRRAIAFGSIKGRALFLIITDLDSDVDLTPLKQLLAMKHEVILISPYTPLFEAHGLVGLDRDLYAVNTAYQRIARRKLLKEASKIGVRVFDVGPKDLFPKLIARVEDLRRMGGS